MATQTTNQSTTLDNEEVIMRAVQFFSTEKWKVTSQSSRSVTFEGKLPIPWFMLLLTIAGFFLCFIPGIILYIAVIKKMHRFMHLVVAVSPITGGSDVCIQHPKEASKLVAQFISALPALNA